MVWFNGDRIKSKSFCSKIIILRQLAYNDKPELYKITKNSTSIQSIQKENNKQENVYKVNKILKNTRSKQSFWKRKKRGIFRKLEGNYEVSLMGNKEAES